MSEQSDDTTERWLKKAEENLDEWGLQDEETLIIAMMEEMGELSQAYLEAEHEGGDPERLKDELDDLGALLYQLDMARQAGEIHE